jgi:hypothetical protein
MGHETRLKDEDKTEDVESPSTAQHLGKRTSRRPQKANRSPRARTGIHRTREKTNRSVDVQAADTMRKRLKGNKGLKHKGSRRTV